MDVQRIKKLFPRLASAEISALKGTNLQGLRGKIHRVFSPRPRDRQDLIFHLRQKLLFDQALDFFKNGRNLLIKEYPEEVVAEEIRKTIPVMGQLTGEIRTDEVIDDIFGRFCIGK